MRLPKRRRYRVGNYLAGWSQTPDHARELATDYAEAALRARIVDHLRAVLPEILDTIRVSHVENDWGDRLDSEADVIILTTAELHQLLRDPRRCMPEFD